MKIDGLRPDPRRPGSIRVLVGGKPAWTVPADVVARLGLVEGGTISYEASEQLERAADVEGALRSALRMLERRAHARLEISRKLRFKGHAPESADAALERLDSLGLIDDAAFAEAYVAARAARGRGPARLRRDLQALGVKPDYISRAVSALDSDEVPDPWELTVRQAERRVAGMRGISREAGQRRLTSFFARRGFRGEEVSDVVDRLLAAQAAGQASG